MVPVGLALLAAWSWGFSAVLVRFGLRDVATAAGTLVSLVAGLVLLAVLVLVFQFDDLMSVPRTAVLLFAIVGILNFPMGRFFNYMAIGRLGITRSTPILASAPLFAVVIAVVFTDEEVQLATALGIALVLAGVYLTISSRPA